MIKKYLCTKCVHLTDKKKIVCKAFPNGIPAKIYGGMNYHLVKHKEQIGDYTFETEDSLHNDFRAHYFKALNDQTWTTNAIKETSISILNKINANEKVQFERFEAFLSAYDKQMLISADLISCHKPGGHSELVSIGFHSNLFKNIRELLYISRAQDYKTDIHFTAFSSGEVKYDFFDFTRKESFDYQYSFRLALQRLENTRLIKNGYKLIGEKDLKRKIQEFSKERKSSIPLHPQRVLSKLQEEKIVADIELIKAIMDQYG